MDTRLTQVTVWNCRRDTGEKLKESVEVMDWSLPFFGCLSWEDTVRTGMIYDTQVGMKYKSKTKKIVKSMAWKPAL